MRGTLHNILFLLVTSFLCACGVNGKLDQNLAEMRSMNKNMEQMNKNMAEGVKNFNDVGASVKALSDESVAFLKKTDPQQFFDMFNKISDKLEETVAGLLDKTGNVKDLVTKANEAMDAFIAYSRVLSPEDLKNLGDSMTSIAGNMKTFNEFLTENSGDLKALSSQLMVSSQMFVTLGRGLNFVNQDDAEALMSMIDANIQGMEVAGSATGIADKMTGITQRMLEQSKNNDLTQLATFAKEMKPILQNLGGIKDEFKTFREAIWNDDQTFNKKWDELDKKFSAYICLVLRTMKYGVHATSSFAPELTEAEKKDVRDSYQKLCVDKKYD